MKQNLEQYLPYLEGLDLSKAEKYALIEVIVSIMTGFVDMAFGLDSTQQAIAARKGCDKNPFQDSVKELILKNTDM